MTARDLEVVRSAQNPLVQRARAVLAGKEPTSIALQGDRLVDDAVTANVPIEVVLLAHDRHDRAERARELSRANIDVRFVDAELLARVSTLASSPGIVALAPTPASHDIAMIELEQEAVVLVVAGIADPGNLGALARAAEAFGAAAFVVIPGGASPWNEKSLRGSMGSLLRLRVATGASADTVASALARRSVHSVRAATRAGADPRTFSSRGPIALWISGEIGDLPAVAAQFDGLTIPMRSGPESLNVTVAASILLYELGRRGCEGAR